MINRFWKMVGLNFFAFAASAGPECRRGGRSGARSVERSPERGHSGPAGAAKAEKPKPPILQNI